MEAWVGFTIFAAAMQTARTAGQKAIVQSLGPETVTAVRYLFALPFVLLYLFLVASDTDLHALSSALSWQFAVYLLLAGIAQIVATLMLVKLLDHRNFAIATVLSKTEALQAAVFGTVFLAALLSWQAWAAVILGSSGVIILSLQSNVNAIDLKSAGLGLLCGAGFALTAVLIREASLLLSFSYVLNAALALAFMTVIQCVLCVLIVVRRCKNSVRGMRAEFVKCVFVGATSAAGSVGWFTALALANAALVRTLGQIEIVFAVLLTYFVFGEKVSMREWFGLALLVSGIILIVWNL